MACTWVGSVTNSPARAAPTPMCQPGIMPMATIATVSTAATPNTLRSRLARAASRARRFSSTSGASSGMISAVKDRLSKTASMSSTLAWAGSNTTRPVLLARFTATSTTPGVAR